METIDLIALSPLDGRYASKTSALREYFSEYALIRYRVLVETEYFIALRHVPLPQLAGIPVDDEALRCLWRDLTPESAARVKEIEKTTNHDVKAVEYYMKERFDAMGLEAYKEFIHFGLTSQDINNTSQPLMLKEALENEYIPALKEVVGTLRGYATEWEDVPMLAKTHGQPATPTRLGKEIMVFVARLEEQLRQFDEQKVRKQHDP